VLLGLHQLVADGIATIAAVEVTLSLRIARRTVRFDRLDADIENLSQAPRNPGAEKNAPAAFLWAYRTGWNYWPFPRKGVLYCREGKGRPQSPKKSAVILAYILLAFTLLARL